LQNLGVLVLGLGSDRTFEEAKRVVGGSVEKAARRLDIESVLIDVLGIGNTLFFLELN